MNSNDMCDRNELLYAIARLAAIARCEIASTGLTEESSAMKCLRKIAELTSLTDTELSNIEGKYDVLAGLGLNANVTWRRQQNRMLEANVTDIVCAGGPEPARIN